MTIGASAATTFARALAFRRGNPAMISDEVFRGVMSISGTWRPVEADADEGPRAWTEDEVIRIAKARRIWEEARDPTRNARRTVSA